MSEDSALLVGLMRLVEEWRSTIAKIENQAAANIVEECALGVENVIDAALANFGPEEADYGISGVEGLQAQT